MGAQGRRVNSNLLLPKMLVEILALVTVGLVVQPSKADQSLTEGAVYSGSYGGKNVVTSGWPNANFFATVQGCQRACNYQNECEVFTYEPKAGVSWAPGACWLFGANAKLET